MPPIWRKVESWLRYCEIRRFDVIPVPRDVLADELGPVATAARP
ncbi:MAG: hypothetical protein ABIR16_08855 [Dokdonella sp.]